MRTGPTQRPRTGGPPEMIRLQFPVCRGMSAGVGSALVAVTGELGLEGERANQVGGWGRDLAARLLDAAPSWSILDVAVESDEEDLYVRMSAVLAASPEGLEVELSGIREGEGRDSADVRTYRGRAYAVLQAAHAR